MVRPRRNMNRLSTAKDVAQSVGQSAEKRQNIVKLPDPIGHPIERIKVTVIYGSLTQVQSPLAVVPRYQGVPLVGPAHDFDFKLDCWLTRIVDIGIVNSILGQAAFLPLKDLHTNGMVQAANLLLVGLGEPGTFAADDLRYLMSNITVALRALGYWQISMPLIGSRRKELPLDRAVTATLQGIRDGHGMFRTMLQNVKMEKAVYAHLLERPLEIFLVEDSSEFQANQIEEAFRTVANDHGGNDCEITVERGANAPLEEGQKANTADVDPDIPITLLRVTKKANEGGTAPEDAPRDTVTFEYSALGEQAVVTVREQEVSSYFLEELPLRMVASCKLPWQEELGNFFLNYLVPDDLRQFVRSAGQLAVIVDGSTAAYPWEMAAFNNHGHTCWLGTDLNLSRRFHSLHSAAPGSPPPINRKLKILIIADPAPGTASLPKARDEAVAVVQALQHAHRAWEGQFEIQAFVRIGSHREPDAASALLEQLRRQAEVVVSAELCDPVELAILVVNHGFDVIHYAGHGMFDTKRQRAGWLFDDNCLLTAKEICRVRQVPRLVFANACFSATADERDGQRQHVVGLAQAFFARGIQNYIGVGWAVPDDLAAQFAGVFYRRVLGLSLSKEDPAKIIGTAPPATLGHAMADARSAIRTGKCSTWAAYQHYGMANDKLLPLPNTVGSNPPFGNEEKGQDPIRIPDATEPADTSPKPVASPTGELLQDFTEKLNMNKPVSNGWDPNKVYINGINPETGAYAIPPLSLDELVRQIERRPGNGDKLAADRLHTRCFAPPFDVKLDELSQAGWGIIFSPGTSPEIRAALDPLIEHRRAAAGHLLKVLDYKPDEQLSDWYRRHNIAVGTFEPESVPYYLLIVGPPSSIPFEFEYLLGVEFAVGRISFGAAEEFARYAKSVIEYETTPPKNKKEIFYWATCHPNDAATNLSYSLLASPLANGVKDGVASLRKPLHEQVGFKAQVHLEDDATKANLLTAFGAESPPAVLFTASHGMAIPAGSARQATDQGGLLCQDWPGFGRVESSHYLAATEVSDSANLQGMIAFLFACFSAGTPDQDQFLMNLASKGEPPANSPFMSALPQRLMSHPRGGALAVIGHIDRAWGYSIQPVKSLGPHIGPFRNGLGAILTGSPVGQVVSQQFGQRFSALSTLLLNALSPTAPSSSKLDDRTLVVTWLERNDAQNYVLLGDPAVRLRVKELADQ